VLAADYHLRLDYLTELADDYVSSGADILIALKQLDPEELGTRSSVRFGQERQILEIFEKPAAGTAPTRIGASLIAIVPAAIRDHLDVNILSRTGEAELSEVFNHMANDGYLIHGRLMDVPPEIVPATEAILCG
jgi:NDP-sugar pyrophosphorylase family protein